MQVFAGREQPELLTLYSVYINFPLHLSINQLGGMNDNHINCATSAALKRCREIRLRWDYPRGTPNITGHLNSLFPLLNNTNP